MDKGAARSKKRAQQLERAAHEKTLTPSAKKSSSSRTSAEAGPSKPRSKPLREPKKQPVREEQSRDPELYKPKAIRSATALIWPCEVPPTSLEGISRVDLTNSGVKDVSWLQNSGVRWLSVSGCEIQDWSAVGSLAELTVLNMNECGLTSLPKELRGLKNLKAVVAMNNPWKIIDDDIVASWPELNSLIISHSPNLVSLPTLSTAIHLTKLTFSHCPRLTSASLPDLSSLPLLHDIKMNNLPLLTTLPPHLLAWGTGPMSSLDPSDTRSGLGLETLDIGSCSLEAKALDSFKKARMGNMRQLTLHHNPLAADQPDYAEVLLQSGAMPKLQIVDNKRVVEKKKHEPVKKSKNKNGKEKKGKPTGTNDSGNVKMRVWGGKDGDDTKAQSSGADLVESVTKDGEEKKEKKRKRVDGEEVITLEKREKRVKSDPSTKADKGERKDKTHKTDRAEGKQTSLKTSAVPLSAQPSRVADPSALKTDKAHRHSKNETGVYGVVEVAGAPAKPTKADRKGKKEKRKAEVNNAEEPVSGGKTGGIDLKAMLNKPDDNGLGVGGW